MDPHFKNLVKNGFMILYLVLLFAMLKESLALIFSLLNKGELLVNWKNGDLEFADYILYYMSGQMATSKDAHSVYDPAMQLKYFNHLISPGTVPKPFFMQSVPFTFILVIPLTLLPITQSYIAWFAVTAVFGAATVFLWYRLFGSGTISALIAICSTAASYPAMIGMRMGQQCWNIMGLLSLYFLSLYKRWDFLCGFLLSIISFKPHYALFCALPAVFNRRWNVIFVAALTEVSLLAVAGWFLGFENVLNYPAIVLHADSTGDFYGVNPHKMISMRLLCTLFLPEKIAMGSGFLIMILGLLVLSLIWFRTIKGGLKTAWEQRWALVLTVLLCIVASPHTHSYDLAMLAPCAFTIIAREGKESDESKTLVFRVWRLILIVYPLLTWMLIWTASLSISLPFVGMLLINTILTILAFLLWRRQLLQQ